VWALGGEKGAAELLGSLKQQGLGKPMAGESFPPGVAALRVGRRQQMRLAPLLRRSEPGLQSGASIALGRSGLPFIQRDGGAQEEQVDVEYSKATVSRGPQPPLGRMPGLV
jgi:hypothetical protein